MTKYRITGAMLPANVDRDGYDTELAATAQADNCDPDGEWTIESYPAPESDSDVRERLSDERDAAMVRAGWARGEQ